jgi:hypothetical protein
MHQGEKPLIDYSQSHVLINSEYLDILRRKTMEKTIVEEIKASEIKDKENKQFK